MGEGWEGRGGFLRCRGEGVFESGFVVLALLFLPEIVTDTGPTSVLHFFCIDLGNCAKILGFWVEDKFFFPHKKFEIKFEIQD